MVSLSSFSHGTPEYDLAHEAMLQFQKWRQNASGGARRIPEHLWLIAARLSKATSVNKASKFLSLDYSKLKSLTKQIESISDSEISEPLSQNDSAPKKRKKPLSKPNSTSCKANEGIPEVAMQSTISTEYPPNRCFRKETPRIIDQSSSVDGFIEALRIFDSSEKTIPKHEILAQIRSPAGHVLELYSEATGSIIEAFLRS